MHTIPLPSKRVESQGVLEYLGQLILDEHIKMTDCRKEGKQGLVIRRVLDMDCTKQEMQFPSEGSADDWLLHNMLRHTILNNKPHLKWVNSRLYRVLYAEYIALPQMVLAMHVSLCCRAFHSPEA